MNINDLFNQLKSTFPKKILIPLLGLFLLLTTLLTILSLLSKRQETRSRAIQGGVNLTLSSKPTVLVGEEFVVNVVIDTNSYTVSAAELGINFPPNILEGLSIQSENFLEVVLSPGRTEPENAFIVLGSPPTAPKNGSGILAKLTFRALASRADPIQISFSDTTKVTAIGYDQNVVGTKPPISVIINEPTGPLPSPTLSPTLAPTPTATPPSSPEKFPCVNPRPETCTMECLANPPYLCGSDGKSYCSKCWACAEIAVDWYVIQNTPCR